MKVSQVIRYLEKWAWDAKSFKEILIKGAPESYRRELESTIHFFRSYMKGYDSVIKLKTKQKLNNLMVDATAGLESIPIRT